MSDGGDYNLDAVVRSIMNDMVECRWRPGESHNKYAEQHNVEVKTVMRWASQAGRFLRLCGGDEEVIRVRIIAGIEKAIELASNAEKLQFSDGEWHAHPQPDVKGLLTALEMLAKAHNVIPSLRSGAGGNAEGKQDMPIEEVVRLLEQAGYKVTRDGS